MILDDLIRLAKAGKKVNADDLASAMKVAGKTAKEIDYAKQGYRLVTYDGVKYKVDWWLNDDEAAQVVWNRVVKPKHQGGEQKIELPSELPKADVVEFKPKKLDPGIYLDEDTGKYFKIDKDGSMTELEADEAP